jgi:hypothetical protein
VLGVFDIIALAFPTPEGEAGPPFSVLVLDALCGVVTLVAVALAWKGHRVATFVAVSARTISALTALPAFFVSGVPTLVIVLATVFIATTIVSVVLMLTPGTGFIRPSPSR